MSHTNGTGTVTRFEAFTENEMQRHETEAAPMVARGVIPLEDVSLNGKLDEGETPADGELEAFREDVLEAVEDVPDSALTTDRTNDEEPREGWQPADVEFAAIWREFNLQDEVSRTQLELALDASSHTGFGNGLADAAIRQGVESVELVDTSEDRIDAYYYTHYRRMKFI